MKPILFNTDMVRAILDGRKTVTRRVVNHKHFRGLENLTAEKIQRACIAPVSIGDILYVRETWVELYYVDEHGFTHYDQSIYCYAADGVPDVILIDPDGFEEDDQRIRWRPSIHMPREAARIFLRVTDVRVDRLQDIDVQDVIREGISPDKVDRCAFCGYGALHYPECDYERCDNYNGLRYLKPFIDIWDSTIKHAARDRYGWSANPWVWVIEFAQCAKPEEAIDGSV